MYTLMGELENPESEQAWVGVGTIHLTDKAARVHQARRARRIGGPDAHADTEARLLSH
jgi:hypothetical protein